MRQTQMELATISIRSGGYYSTTIDHFDSPALRKRARQLQRTSPADHRFFELSRPSPIILGIPHRPPPHWPEIDAGTNPPPDIMVKQLQ